MIERVAKAISRSIPLDGSHWHSQHGHDFPRQYSEREQNIIRGIARAAIEAMREPTEMMSRAGMKSIQAWEDNDPNGILMDFRELSCWRAMIDAALSQDTLHSSSSAEPPSVADAQAGGDHGPSHGASPSAAQFPE